MRPFLLTRRALVVGSGLAAAGVRAAAPDAYPRTAVKIIIPFAPGGPTDTVGRLIAQKLQDVWGQPVVIDYKPGASTTIGTDYVAKSAPDGLTIGMVNSSFATNPSLHRHLPFDIARDLAGVTHIGDLQLAVVAQPNAPYNNMREFIAYAKKNPGKLSYGTPGAGSTTHLGAELLKREAGFDMLHVPYKGSSPAQTELMGGRLDLLVDPFLSVLPFIKAGRMKLLATMGAQRVPGFSYPTVAETVPGFDVNALLGFVVPRATPPAIVAKIQQDTARVLGSADTRKRIEDQGVTVVASTPAEFDAFVQTETKRWARIIAQAGIQAE